MWTRFWGTRPCVLHFHGSEVVPAWEPALWERSLSFPFQTEVKFIFNMHLMGPFNEHWFNCGTAFLTRYSGLNENAPRLWHWLLVPFGALLGGSGGRVSGRSVPVTGGSQNQRFTVSSLLSASCLHSVCKPLFLHRGLTRWNGKPRHSLPCKSCWPWCFITATDRSPAHW